MFLFKKKPQSATELPDIESAQRPNVLERLGGVNNIFRKINDRADAMVETSQNYQTGIVIIGAGFVFMLLSLFFLPLFIIKPYKFCALYSMGTITIFSGILVAKGRGMREALLSKRYLLFTLLFLASFALELYYAVLSPQYFMVIVFLGLHTASTLYLLLAAVPGGTRVLNACWGFFFSSLKQLAMPERRASLSI